MRTHGHREGSLTHCGQKWGARGGIEGVGRVGRDNEEINTRYR